MGVVCFDITMELIRDVLAIPDDVEIILINQKYPKIFTFYVESDQFPEVNKGENYKEVRPVLTWKRADERPRDFISFDWNIAQDEPPALGVVASDGVRVEDALR